MAALVEDARWRTSARGNRYLMATCSDASGQFMASCFDDEVSVRIEEAAKAGGCGLLMVELDRKPGDETPRVTIRNIRPFEGMTMATRLRLDVTLDDPAGAAALAGALDGMRGGRGELHLFARCPMAANAHLSPGATICSMPRWCSGSRSCRGSRRRGWRRSRGRGWRWWGRGDRHGWTGLSGSPFRNAPADASSRLLKPRKNLLRPRLLSPDIAAPLWGRDYLRADA